MALATIEELESDQLPVPSSWETPPMDFAAEEIDIVAFKLWRRANCLDLTRDDCRCCKGEALQCYATCR